MEEIYKLIDEEVKRKIENGRVIGNPHEGWALILEEVDELWKEVKKKTSKRDKERMKEEAVQIAATAIRFIKDLCKGQ